MAKASSDGSRPYVQNALRVSQLDASELDLELFELFKAELRNVFKYFKSNFLVRFGPEVSAVLRCLLWHYSIRTAEATIGQKLLDLKYMNDVTTGGQQDFWMTKRQKLLYAVVTIGGPWIEERIEDIKTMAQPIPHLKNLCWLLQLFAKTCKIAVFANFLVFLFRGKHLFLTERLIGVTAIFPRPHGIRQVGFEMMNRELLWHGFAEFLFFALPLINFRRLKNFFARHLLAKPSSSGEAERTAANYKECVICGQWPFNPHQIGCRHVFCYYCVQSNYKADPSFSCPVCQRGILTADDVVPVPIKSISVISSSQ